MRPDYEQRWLAVAEREVLKHPRDLIERRVSNEDYVDAAMIGSLSVADVLAGKISESEIPPEVIESYHLQYPNQDGFVEGVRSLHGDPEALRGLISGVKGKLFEIKFLDHLNDGGLPAGWTAELASSANQPGWDVLIRDADGTIHSEVQLKATQSVEYVREALERYPDFEIGVTHEVYTQLAADPALAPMVFDSGESLGTLDHVVSASVDEAAIHFGLLSVEIAVAFAVVQNFLAYRNGRTTLLKALKNVGVRGVLVLIARGAAFGAATATGAPLVAVPVAAGVRILCGRVMRNLDRRREFASRIAAMNESISRLRVLQMLPVVIQ